ncbi:GDSL Lipase/Acylhydrolase family protein [Pseudohyphozyma bogoriensis]|nr:GDSL Lipase/Acylhydrolase family protein [Pseudohyphozyma bogoriensis]
MHRALILTPLVAALSYFYLKSTMPSTKPSQSVVFDQVVLFGDSITQGSWAYKWGLGASLTNFYQRKLDVINRGLSAVWTIPIAEKWLPRVGEDRPKIKLLTIWFGANDAALPPSPQAVTIPEFKANLHTLISFLTSPTSPYYSPDTKILLLTPPPVDAQTRNNDLATRDPPRPADRDAERTRLFAEAVKEVATEAGLNAVDTWTAISVAAEKNGLDKYLSDGLHLTGEGYEIVTTEVANAIKTHLPELHWDNLEQVFPHWADIVNKGALGPQYLEKKAE